MIEFASRFACAGLLPAREGKGPPLRQVMELRVFPHVAVFFGKKRIFLAKTGKMAYDERKKREEKEMKDILLFYRDDCGYCHRAHQALDELMDELPGARELKITQIEETREPELADRYDYYAVPTFYVDGVKLFEAHIGMSYEAIKCEVRRVLEAALA